MVAKIVAGFGAPHSPHVPEQVRLQGPSHPVVPLYAHMAEAIEDAAPDVLIVFDCDHFSTFFLDNLPIFAIGVDEKTGGPNDQTRMPRYEVPLHAGLAAHLRAEAIAAGFDVSLLQDFEVDHSVLVPLHFLTPRMHIPIIPIFINCFVPPVPSARRCYALGQAIRSAVESFPQSLRVAPLASGNFSLEIGGPKVAPGKRQGVPDPAWTERVAALMQEGATGTLLEEATFERMLRAGNVATELLIWIAMLGAVGDCKPEWMQVQPREGEAYGIWRLAA
jgi:aromatic ring-opening dioxygenase catalytic subunit (LigB family)